MHADNDTSDIPETAADDAQQQLLGDLEQLKAAAVDRSVPDWFILHYVSPLPNADCMHAYVFRMPGRFGDREFESAERAVEAAALLIANDRSIDSMLKLSKFVERHSSPAVQGRTHSRREACSK